MKIGLIIPNLNGGGAEQAILRIARSFIKHGHEVHLIALKQEAEHAVDIPVTYLSSTKTGRGLIGKYRYALKLKRFITKEEKAKPFDLLISTLPFCDEVVHLAGIPDVWFRIANNLEEEINKLKHISGNKAKRRLKRYKKLYNNKKVIAISNGVASSLTDGLGITPSVIKVIYNPCPFDEIIELGNKANPHPQQSYVLHPARFNAQKRHDVLLSAWKKNNLPHKLILLTRHDPKLQALIDKYGLTDRVEIAGFQKNPYRWIKHADLVVLSSDHEGLGNVLLESVILGTNFVSTDCPSGPREIAADLADQLLVPVGDSDMLAKRIEEMIDKPFIKPGGFDEKFSEENGINAYLSLINGN